VKCGIGIVAAHQSNKTSAWRRNLARIGSKSSKSA